MRIFQAPADGPTKQFEAMWRTGGGDAYSIPYKYYQLPTIAAPIAAARTPRNLTVGHISNYSKMSRRDFSYLARNARYK